MEPVTQAIAPCHKTWMNIRELIFENQLVGALALAVGESFRCLLKARCFYDTAACWIIKLDKEIWSQRMGAKNFADYTGNFVVFKIVQLD